jgi:SAM-dependent methyltransferase
MSELLLGCGFARQKLMAQRGHPLSFADLVTLDYNAKCKPDLVCDMDMPYWDCSPMTERGRESVEENFMKLRVKSDYFDEVHAYEVLEHLGGQGKADEYFWTFENIHRVLKSGGFLFATVPSRHSPWAWGDPSHRRVIQQESLAFLSQKIVAQNRARGTQMSDFSDLWALDFDIIASSDDHINHKFCLQAVK